MVLDGLRRDAINPTDTPNLYRLRQQGVTFSHADDAPPSVTEVNSATIATGTYPAKTGIIQNTMYLPDVNPDAPVKISDTRDLIKLRDATGSVLLTDSVAARLKPLGKRVVTIGSGTSGASYMLDPDAEDGAGVMISTGDPTLQTPLAIPASQQQAILARFGPPPSKTGVPNLNATVDYMTNVLLGYVLPDLAPDVAYVWFTEPDNTEHAHGAGSPESLEGIHNDDRNVGLILDYLQRTGVDANIFVTADHGFSQLTFGVNVPNELVAGLKESATSTDVVATGFAESNISVRNRDPQRIRDIVEFFQRQPYTDAIYTAARRPAGGRYRTVPHSPGHSGLDKIARGWVDGTFSLELLHNDPPRRAADIVVSFRWSSDPNPFGVPGTTATSSTGPTGPITNGGVGNVPAAGHGTFSPWVVQIPLFMTGPDFKSGVEAPAPAGNVDITPTIMALEGAGPRDLAELDGRVLSEAFLDGPDPYMVPFDTRTLTTGRGSYRTAVQVSSVGDTTYVDRSWRMP